MNALSILADRNLSKSLKLQSSNWLLFGFDKRMLNLVAMTITPDQFKEIMRLFDAGDFESRKEAITMLYKGYSRHYLVVIKRDFMHNNYDDDTAAEVLQDVFLSLLSKQTKPSS